METNVEGLITFLLSKFVESLTAYNTVWQFGA
jgi:hypothetical protein